MSEMVRERPVVVGIDAADTARQATSWGAAEAARRHVPLRLVHTVNTVNLSAYGHTGAAAYSSQLAEYREQDGRARLASAREQAVEQSPDLAVRAELGTGHPAEVLIAESATASLVVLGGRDDGPHRIGDSLALALAAHGHCPVAVIRDSPLPDGGPVVVGVDGSPASESATGVAFEEASARRTELLAVHAWTEFASDTEYRYARQVILDWRPIETEQAEMLAQRLAGWTEKYPDVPVRRVVTRENSVDALLGHSADAQLLVVGSRGRGGFTGMLLGSTSRKLIHRGSCPLLIVRQDKNS